MPTVEFFFDFGSPTAYLAFTQMPGIAERTGATLIHRPMLLGGVFKATGNRSPAEVPAKSAWMRQDMQRFAERYGVPFSHNPNFPINTLYLMRGAVAAQHQARFREYADAVFHAMWVAPRNLGEPAEVGAVLAAAGFDPAAFLAAMEAPEVKDELRATTEEAVARGVFGAPTCFVGAEMFFGQDRLDQVEEALRRAA